jgi:hypothetical protein
MVGLAMTRGSSRAGLSITQPFRLTRPRMAGTAMKRSTALDSTSTRYCSPSKSRMRDTAARSAREATANRRTV